MRFWMVRVVRSYAIKEYFLRDIRVYGTRNDPEQEPQSQERRQLTPANTGETKEHPSPERTAATKEQKRTKKSRAPGYASDYIFTHISFLSLII